MIDGIPNRPLYFYQKDILDSGVGGFLFKTLLIALVFCLAVTLFGISLQGAAKRATHGNTQRWHRVSEHIGRSRVKKTHTFDGEFESHIIP